MTDKSSTIRMVSVQEIAILNPRARNKKVFNELVASIANLGLKKPITVSKRRDGAYDLVCGQGRLEAFIALGQSDIPAIVLEISKEDCFVMSLVENLARRQHSPIELMREVGALRNRGYSIGEIAAKTDFSEEYVYAICFMLDHGEDRLLAGIERGVIPAGIAIEIARAKEADVQAALADAYEKKTLPGNQYIAIRRIIEQRNLTGKSIHTAGKPPAKPTRITSEALVRAYRKETERQRVLIKKANIAQSRMIFVSNALKRLLADEHFVTLLRAEGLHTLPRPLADRLGFQGA